MRETFVCSGCEHRCQMSYRLENGAMTSPEGMLCPKGMQLLVQENLPLYQGTTGSGCR